MTRRILACAAVLALPLPTLLAGDPPRGDGIRFAWPVPGRATVTEVSEKNGKTVKARYTLRLSAAPEGDDLHLRYEDYDILEFNGRSTGSPEARKTLAPALALASAIPTLVISKGGEFQDAIGMEETIERTLECLGAMQGPDVDPATREMLRKTLQSPQMLAQLKAKSADAWNAWVGTWVEHPVRDGESTKLTTSLPFPDGSTFDAPMTLRHRGAALDAPGHVRLEIESVLEGPAFRDAMIRALKSLTPPGAQKPGGSRVEDEILGFRREFRSWVVTEPASLKPLRAESDALITVTGRTGEPQKQRERRVYEFNWNAPGRDGGQ
jgi:hypothetical protein